jgi:uncharacterized protein (UPF0262 family)
MSDAGGGDVTNANARLIEVSIDEDSLAPATADAAHERRVAIYDLIESNQFQPIGDSGGPYRLAIALRQNRLMFAIGDAAGREVATHYLSLTPLRRLVRDYFLICDSHYAAIKTAAPSQIEAIDMGRRGLHNDAAQVLRDRLAGKVEMDFATARRLFTLIVALHWRA